MSGDDEVPLDGGFINIVVRAGDTVRRSMPANAEWVHALLDHLHAHGFDAAPRPLGIDEQGREILSWIDGEARRGPEPDDAVLAEVMRLARRVHDLTAGTDFAGDQECVIHGDLSPRNTIYRGGRPVAFIDWDVARPGSRRWDVSRACWQYVDPGAGCDPAEVARRWRLMIETYGLDVIRPSALVGDVLDRLTENADGIEAEAAAGSQPHVRLVEMGAPASIRMVHRWVSEHRAAIEAALA